MQPKPKTTRRKKIIKIRAEINDRETKKAIKQIKETRRWFFEKINKIDKPLARPIKKKNRETGLKQHHKRKRRNNTTTEIQTTARLYYEKLYANKLHSLKGMNKFLETHKPSKLKEEEIENLN